MPPAMEEVAVLYVLLALKLFESPPICAIKHESAPAPLAPCGLTIYRPVDAAPPISGEFEDIAAAPLCAAEKLLAPEHTQAKASNGSKEFISPNNMIAFAVFVEAIRTNK